MDRSHILLVVRFRARSSLKLILTSAGPEMCRVVVGLTCCNKGNTPFVRNVKETKWATLPRHSTVIPIAKKCPKNQILSENISKWPKVSKYLESSCGMVLTSIWINKRLENQKLINLICWTLLDYWNHCAQCSMLNWSWGGIKTKYRLHFYMVY